MIIFMGNLELYGVEVKILVRFLLVMVVIVVKFFDFVDFFILNDLRILFKELVFLYKGEYFYVYIMEIESGYIQEFDDNFG